MAPVVWFLVLHEDGDVSVEYKVWEGWTQASILALNVSVARPNPKDKWKDSAILRVDENESYIVPF